MLSAKICLLTIFVNCYAFNIDTNFPIIYEDPFKFLPNLNKSSYFGYSLVLYPGSERTTPWLLIGAPRGLNASGVSTGVCFKCGIGEKCEALDISDPSKRSSNNLIEKLDNAWIGGSMDINYRSDRVVTCAPRWIREKPFSTSRDFYMQGACYWLHTNDSTSQKLLPLVGSKHDVYTHPGGRSVYNYAQGQAGFSIHMPLKEHAMLLGAPGVYNWDGTSILYKDSVDSSPVASRFSNPRRRSRNVESVNEFGDVNIASAIDTRETLGYDLLGYSSSSGYFYDKLNLYYVSGAPRSSYRGQVLIYTFSKANESPLFVKEFKQGRQFGEYFGGSVTVGDINNDGLDDLIVGAPFHKADVYNQGKIYIFLGKANRVQESVAIPGPRTNGQFGATLQYLGDIDHDGFGDVAVAAPYEEESSGVLYLFQGNREGLNTEYSQRIVGKDVYDGIRGFGISISRAVDMDSNKYPDIAVGAYLSGHVVLLRSRPVIRTHQELRYFPMHLQPKTKSFTIEECFGYKLDDKYPDEITINRTLLIDQQLGRAFLEKNDVTVLTLSPGRLNCRNVTVTLLNSVFNRYDPITVTLSHDFIEKQQSKQIIYVGKDKSGDDMFCPRCPVYDKRGSKSSETLQIPFALGCASNVCNSNLELEAKIIDIKDSMFVLGSTNDVTLQIDIKNTGERAYLTQVLVTLPEIVTFRRTPSQCTEKNTSSVLCSVDNPIDENKEKTVMLDLDMSKINSGKYDDSLTFTVEVMTSSENNGDKIKEVVVKLTREADVAITGKSVEQSYSYRNITEGKSNFTQEYQVEKFGSSPLNSILIEINVPYLLKVSDGSEIKFTGLYPPVGSAGYTDVSCKSNFTYLEERRNTDSDISADENDLKAEVDDPKARRLLKRSTMDVEVFNKSKIVKAKMMNENDFDAFQNRTFYINCSMNEVVCSKVLCTTGPIKSGQVVKIKLPMLLDIAAVKDLLGKKDAILFATQGRVIVTNPPNFVQSGDKPDSVEVASLFIGNSKAEIVALWIIILSAVAGLLLLMLLIFGLIKLGFFKRTAKEELEQLKKEIQDNEEDKITEQEIMNESLE